MFLRKKSVVVNVVNTSELKAMEDDQETVDPNFGAHVYVIMNNAAYLGAFLIGSYFLADTIRHCVIHTVATKVTPPIVVEAAIEAAKTAKK